MLTTAEIALLSATLGTASTLLGSAVTSRGARAAAREQWRRERNHARLERRAEIYQDMILVMEQETERAKARIRHHDSSPGGRYDGSVDAVWSAKAVLFGSEDMVTEWRRWSKIIDEGWSFDSSVLQQAQVDDWQERLSHATLAVFHLMRAEVGTNTLPWPSWWTRAWQRLTRTPL